MSDNAPTDAPADEPIEPTQAPAEIGKQTQDFVGIRMKLDRVISRVLAVDADRMQFVLSLAVSEQTMPLIGAMLLHRGGDVFVGFGFMQNQGALPFPEAGVSTFVDPADPTGAVVMKAINAQGDTFYPHNFIKGGANDTCASCLLVFGHGIHSAESIAARKAHPSDSPTPVEAGKAARGRRGKSASNGHGPDDASTPETNEIDNTSESALSPEVEELTNKLNEGLVEGDDNYVEIGPLRTPPADDDEAAAQAQAAEDLAARARS